MLEKQKRRIRRHKRIRSKIFGTAKKPRLSVFRSGKHIYAQLIDDEKRKTVARANDFETDKKKKVGKDDARSGRVLTAFKVGKLLAQKALEKKIEKVVFDRGGYPYKGIVKALAEGSREGGLKF